MQQNITGRDGFIPTKALAYAIIAIQIRPEEFREESDLNDMRSILAHLVPDEASREAKLSSARSHLMRLGLVAKGFGAPAPMKPKKG